MEVIILQKGKEKLCEKKKQVITVLFTYKRDIFRRTLVKYQKEFDNV